jgi:hypothetical protein
MSLFWRRSFRPFFEGSIEHESVGGCWNPTSNPSKQVVQEENSPYKEDARAATTFSLDHHQMLTKHEMEQI